MTTLNKLKAPKGANKKMKRVGRGESSGHGKTATRGGKGQTARKGNSKPRLGFEGGQTQLWRRLPKRGFKNVWAKKWVIVNIKDLNVFDAGSVVDAESLKARGLVKGSFDGVRVLGDGELEKKLTVKAWAFTETAKAKIAKAGGTVEVLAK